jgi:hypothetical protein
MNGSTEKASQVLNEVLSFKIDPEESIADVTIKTLSVSSQNGHHDDLEGGAVLHSHENLVQRTPSKEYLFIGEDGFQSYFESVEDENEAFFANLDSSSYLLDAGNRTASGSGLAVVRAIRSSTDEGDGDKQIPDNVPVLISDAGTENSESERPSSRTSIYTEGESYTTYATESERSGYSSYSNTPGVTPRGIESTGAQPTSSTILGDEEAVLNTPNDDHGSIGAVVHEENKSADVNIVKDDVGDDEDDNTENYRFFQANSFQTDDAALNIYDDERELLQLAMDKDGDVDDN